MANACLNSYSSNLLCKNKPTERFISSSSSSSSPSSLRFPFSPLPSISISHVASEVLGSSALGLPNKIRVLRVLAVTEEEPITAADVPTPVVEEVKVEDGNGSSEESKVEAKTCEIYVCNIPRSYDVAELTEMFQRFGTVHSVKISRNPETGISKGCGFVTMGSAIEAKVASSALDGSDVGGREMRIRFSSHIKSKKNKDEVTNITFESPHKIYVGNLSWSVRPEDLRAHFSQYGNVVSARTSYDRKGGKKRVYGFLSFSSAEEGEAALKSNGTEFAGRTMVIRQIKKDTET